MFLPQLEQNFAFQSRISPQEQTILDLINLLEFNGLSQFWQNLAEIGFLCPQTQTITDFSFFKSAPHSIQKDELISFKVEQTHNNDKLGKLP